MTRPIVDLRHRVQLLMLPMMVFSMSTVPRSTYTTGSRTLTDVIHRSIDLHPFCAQIVDTPEFQRLRDVSQLGTCSWVFPCAVHDRFSHSIGVAHMASSFAQHLRNVQPELKISDQDILCVTVAGAEYMKQNLGVVLGIGALLGLAKWAGDSLTEPKDGPLDKLTKK